MIRILFLINTLGGGGAERVLVNLVNNMDKSRFDITVETMFDGGVNAELLSKDVKYVCQNAFCPKGIAYIYRLIPSKLLYKYFIGKEKYDILIAFMHGAPVKVISGCGDKNVKKAAWLHNGNPETGTFFKFWFDKKVAFKAYSNCDKIVGVSEAVSKAFRDYTGIKEKICTVYNTNDTKKIRELASKADIKESKALKIVSVGRISDEKGFDRLFNICLKLKEEYDIEVTIVGSGSGEDKLRKMIEDNEASDWFRLAGYQSNPYKYVAGADLFVCSSRTEGLSTAVTEAVILGIPVVSTDVSGAKEILGENSEYGMVVENSEQGLYNGIKKMLEDSGLRAHYREKAKERAPFFDTANTVAQAQKLFEDLLSQK